MESFNDEQEKHVCGNCKHHQWDGLEFECRNPLSRYNSDYTDWGHSCEDWEEKQ